MTLVIDTSVVVAALVDSGDGGRWSESIIAGEQLVAPHLMPAEVLNILRRLEWSGALPPGEADLASMSLMALPVALVGIEGVRERVWELRHTLTPYDAWYVALAESLGCRMATLDKRLSRSPGVRATVVTPSD